MPFYEYICNKCHKKFEKSLIISDRYTPEKEVCPSCGGKKCVVYIIGAPNIDKASLLNSNKHRK